MRPIQGIAMSFSFSRWLSRLFGSAARKSSQRVLKRQRQTVLRLECLEDRVTPSITVTSNYDGATDGSRTTLIGAILAADSGEGNTIILPSATTFTLSPTGYLAPISGNGSVNTGMTLLPGINQAITIDGNGSTIEVATGAVGRFFSITSSLTLNNVNLIGGVAQGGNGGSGGGGGGGGGAGLGGAIFVNGSGALLTMNQSSIAYSSAIGGGGGYFLAYTSGPNQGGLQGIGGGGPQRHLRDANRHQLRR